MSNVMWAVKGRMMGEYSFYVGTWLRRAEAIEGHVSAHLYPHEMTPENIKKKWRERHRRGDRCVKVRLVEMRRG